ncbi:hypothetical protein LZC95_19735 [Pendulispora brunnea]|uniref:Uncharacterized protein n=1 Tax=Pendulispora brunnea TaxID=2905690 RepID=A0ABZ2KN75_9BACT
MNNEIHALTAAAAPPLASPSPLSAEQRHLRHLEKQVHREYETLLIRVEGLARQLSRLAASLQTHGVQWRVASDGAVRGQGLDIDLACARFSASLDALASFRAEFIDEG